MTPLITHRGVIIPFARANVDTDMLLPKQYLKSLEAFGFGDFLFDDERWLDPGEIDTPRSHRRPNPDFILNQPIYQHGSILLSHANFGCGSSREHAVWALRDFGIRVVIAPSYGDIFRNNCFNNGVLPIQMAQDTVDALFALTASHPGIQAHVDVEACMVSLGEQVWSFALDAGRRRTLLNGLDAIGESLSQADAIRRYESLRREREPWVFRHWQAGEG